MPPTFQLLNSGRRSLTIYEISLELTTSSLVRFSSSFHSPWLSGEGWELLMVILSVQPQHYPMKMMRSGIIPLSVYVDFAFEFELSNVYIIPFLVWNWGWAKQALGTDPWIWSASRNSWMSSASRSTAPGLLRKASTICCHSTMLNSWSWCYSGTSDLHSNEPNNYCGSSWSHGSGWTVQKPGKMVHCWSHRWTYKGRICTPRRWCIV